MGTAALDRIAQLVAAWREGRRPAGQVLLAIEDLVREESVEGRPQGRSFVGDGLEIYTTPLG